MTVNHRYIPKGDEHERLATLIADALGIEVSPEKVRDFIINHWQAVKLYAHAIHEHYERPASSQTPKSE